MKKISGCTDIFQQGCFKINFRRIDDFGDGLEGWDHSIPNLKKIIKERTNFINRVIKDGGFLVKNNNPNQYLEGKRDGNYIEKRDLVSENMKERELNFASCWFASKSKDYESRVMWNLYAEVGGKNANTGVMISVKWSELKAPLELQEDDFLAGFVDYSNSSNKGNIMFKKDNSYFFEKEFRILIKQSEHSNDIVLNRKIDSINSPKIYCKIWDSHDNQLAIKKVEELGFEKMKNAKREYDVSNLIPEIIRQSKSLYTPKSELFPNTEAHTDS